MTEQPQHRAAAEVIRFPGADLDHDGPDAPPAEPLPGADEQPPRAEVVGPLVEAELVDEQAEAAEAPPVDAPDRGDWLAELAERARTARPIVPAYLATGAERARLARFLAAYSAHVAAYHATRTPWYLVKLLGRSPRGTGRLVVRWWHWVADAESKPLRLQAVARGDTSGYLMLKREHDRIVRPRRYASAVLGLAVLLGAVVAAGAVPTWAVWVGVGVLLSALGAAGGRKDAPLIGRAVLAPQVTKLDSDTVLRALGSLGIAEVTKALGPKGAGIAFVAPIVQDGPGWRAEVDLPYGVTALDVIERRDKLASGLRRPLGCVWPEPVNEEHPGRLVVWVGQQALNAQPPVSWPLAKSGTADLFTPVPFGADVRGRPVEVCLMFESVLIGAKPRMGKTFALRVLLLAAALDPGAELRTFELKGTGDCRPLAKVSHDYGSGADEDTIGRCLSSLRSAHRELDTRAATISRIAEADPARCPENKVTPELAGAGLGLHPLVIAIDECQELFGHSDKDTAKEAARLAEAIIKRGPAMGVILLLATQRPDANSLPTGVSANVGIRFCLRVMGQTENDMVLGTSAYRNGVRATMFTGKDKGIGYLDGVADDPQIVRTAYIDAPAAERIADRARAVRAAAGTLTGYAAGNAPEVEDTSTLLDHLLAVWPGDAEAVWSVRLVAALAEYRPETYGPWQEIADERERATQLANALSPFKVRTKQIKQDGVNKRGVEREAVEKAAGR
ncbi:DUF3631 domain-containing protein [Streptomonospora sp. PA3]|uniref:DUF3631 domain-containing protein n=1 Tax=Streptomonospora sp. PA3 TaxID=2607326 RepID=UPI0012DE0A4A|nr:DUF3631 domain-containing protein [Streptomonospora sp. PA3]MUL39703.1 DUF3631 domain-containing protein [Streptomonospora sp. PA3]